MKVVQSGLLAAALVLVIPTTTSANDGPQALSERTTGSDGRVRVEPALVIEAVAVPSTSPIVVDGRFNEEIWQQAPAISEFQQREPAEGQPPTQRTEARMAYDDQALYVAVRAFDNDPDKLVGILTRRDQRSPSEDRKSTRLNSSHSQISYAVFCLKKKKKKTQ